MSENNEKSVEKAEDEGHEYPGTARLADLMDIVNNPGKYGFEWTGWDASSKKDKDGVDFPGGLTVLRKDFKVLPKVTNGAKFCKYFGDSKLVDSYNGTSGRVAAQDVGRSLLLDHWKEQRAAKVTELQGRIEVVKRHLLGLRKPGSGGGVRKHWVVNGVVYMTESDAIAASKVQPKVYTALDGTTHKTPLEAKQATVAFLTQVQGMALEVAQKLVANMPE